MNDDISGNGGSDYMVGGAGDDYIINNSSGNVMYGGNGNDRLTIHDGGDNNIIDGGEGNDIVTIHSGNNNFANYNLINLGNGNNNFDGYGAGSHNAVYGGEGDDTINAWDDGSYNFIDAGEGNNYIEDNAGDVYDTIYAGSGDDTIIGTGVWRNEGQCFINAGSGNNYIREVNYSTITTGSGDDTIYGGWNWSNDGYNLINAGEGNNYINNTANSTITAGSGDDIIGYDHPEHNSGYGGDNNLIYAGAGNDLINAGSNSRIYAEGGNDYISLFRVANVFVDMGDGDDYAAQCQMGDYNTINGGSGNDTINTTGSYNTINGGDGNDSLFIEFTNNTIIGGEGDDYIHVHGDSNLANAGNGNDFIYIEWGNSTINGGDGNDTVYMHGSNNIINTGNGDDYIYGEWYNNALSDSSGIDTLDLSNLSKNSVNFDVNGNDLLIDNSMTIKNWFLSSANKIENFIFSEGTMTSSEIDEMFIFGDSGNNNIIGTSGNDKIYGGDGNDTIKGGEGIDTVYGGAGDDEIWNNPEVNYFYGGEGNDTYYINSTENIITEYENEGTDLVSSSVSHYLESNVENLTLTGIDNINGSGNQLDNIIIGNSGNNIIDGAFGADTMVGEAGDDNYYVDNINDIVIENQNEGVDTVYSTVSHALSSNVENLTFMGTDNVDGEGNDLDNIIIGNSGNNVLAGGAGNDSYIFNLGDGDDIINDRSGVDTIKFGEGVTLDNISIINNGNDNIITYGDKGDSITILDQANSSIIETIQFSDETTYSLISNTSMNAIMGTNGDDNLSSTTSYGVVYGGEGNDILSTNIAGTHIFEGNAGDDTYLVNQGNGNIYIKDVLGTNTITFGEGITKDNITFMSGTNSNLVIQIQGMTDKITVENQLNSNNIENFIFADGSSYTSNDLLGLLEINGTSNDDIIFDTNFSEKIYGYEGNDNIIAMNGGNDTIYGGAGNDTIDLFGFGNHIIYGGEGNDIIRGGYNNDAYFFNLGDGNDTIEDFSGSNTITFGEGISKENIIFNAEGNDIIISFLDSSDTIKLNSGRYSLPENIFFNDGTNYSADEVNQRIVIYGTNGDDNISGSFSNDKIYGLDGNDVINSFFGNDTIYGGAGNDTISGDESIYVDAGEGDDYIIGRWGNGTYVFNIGDGNDTITDENGNDTIIFGEGISKTNTKFYSNNDDIFIKIIDSTDSIRILNKTANVIENYVFADGSSYIYDEVLGLLEINTSPIATLTSATLEEDSSVILDVLANATDVDGDTLAIGSFTQGTNGSITLNSENNELIYTPISNYNGIDSFTYTISDGNGGTITKTVDLTINAINDIPVATIISGAVDEDNSLILDVLAGASDVDGNTLSISEFTQGTNGIITLNENNELIYTPNANYNGTDTFTYTLSDGNGGTVTKTVDLTINAINDIPVATIISGAVDEDNSLILDVLAGASDVEGDTLTISEFTQGANGAVTVNENDDLIYTPNTHYSGSDSFTYTISDGNGGTVIETINMTINPLPANITGDSADNVLTGNYKDNIIIGGLGSDSLVGGSGNDTYIFNPGDGNDIITDSSGTDSIQFGQGITKDNIIFSNSGDDLIISFTDTADSIRITPQQIENFIFADGSGYTSNEVLDIASRSVFGTQNQDTLIGTESDNYIYGQAGNDSISAGAGNDTIYGGDGNDSIDTNSGNDYIYAGAGNDMIVEQASDSILYSYIDGEDGNDTIYSGIGSDTVYGGSGDDYIRDAGGDNNYFYGGAGNDLIFASQGANNNYFFNIGDGNDAISNPIGSVGTVFFGEEISKNNIKFVEDGTSIIAKLTDSNDSLKLASQLYGNRIRNLIFADGTSYTAAEIKALIEIDGTTDNDSLKGSIYAETLYGYAGDDTINAGNGNDTLIGGVGTDSLLGGAGNDFYSFSSGDGDDVISDSSGVDTITLDSTVNKSDVAMYMDSNNNLIIDYGSTGGQDVVNIQNQLANTIEQVQLGDGEYMTSTEINSLIQNMAAYAANNSIEFTGISDVKDNQDLMTMVASAWHS